MLDHVWTVYDNLVHGRWGCFKLCQIMSGRVRLYQVNTGYIWLRMVMSG